MKRKIKAVICSLLIFILSLQSAAFVYASPLYENCEENQTLTSGVVYKKLSRLYPAGWMDIYVLEIDPTDENVGFKVLESTTELGLKHTVEQLANDNNSLAAVNGDFFGSGTPLSSMGQVARNGEMEAVQNYYNGSENRYAGFFVDSSGTPFIDYVKSTLGFYTSGDVSIEMGAKNKYTDFSKPVYFDRNAITSTAQIDARRSDLVKIVVQEGVITDISGAGETVEVPENGYIIAMNSTTASQKLSGFYVGQTVGFSQNNTFVFRPEKEMSSIKIGLSGGGELLRNGEKVSSGLIISENARNPRTIIGVNQNKDKVYIVCIDGRGDSIGATHAEAADIMLDLGAYDAIHFDGGGSTTMALQEENTDNITVVNTPSEGTQRQVANGFGVASVGESTGLDSLQVVLQGNEDNLMFENFGTAVTVYGKDNNYNTVDVNTSTLEYSANIDGSWNGNVFTPHQTGEGTITVKSGSAVGTLKVKVLEGASGLKVTTSTTKVSVGDSVALNVEAINKDGFSIPASASDVTWSVDDEDVATVSNGVLYAKSEGNAVVTAKYNTAEATISISVGTKYVAVMSFESKRNLTTTYNNTDGTISGTSSLTSNAASDGSSSLMISYSFAPSLTTSQAVYSVLDTPIALPENASDLYLECKGGSSDKNVRVVVVDANNKEYNVDIPMTGGDWTKVSGTISSSVVFPAQITKIGVLALNTDTDNTTGTVYIDNIGVVTGSAISSDSTEFTDSAYAQLTGTAPDGYEDITVFGQTASYSGDKATAQSRILNAMSNARAMVFAGSTNISNTTDTVSVAWDNKYYTTDTDYFSIINLATSSGSLITDGSEQLYWLQSYIRDMSKTNIIINMDKDMIGNGSTFTDSRQKEALKNIFKQAALEYGKNIIVVSAVGSESYSETTDGVRYINLAGLSESSLKYLRIRGNGSSFQYEIAAVS